MTDMPQTPHFIAGTIQRIWDVSLNRFQWNHAKKLIQAYGDLRTAETRLTVLEPILKMVDAQAEDEGLWCKVTRASEAYLQQELRKLHAVVEQQGKP